MSKKNRISQVLTEETEAKIMAALAGIKTDLDKVLIVNYTPEERSSMVRASIKRKAFLKTAMQYAKENPSLVPSYLDMEEAVKDFSLSKSVGKIRLQIEQLNYALQDASIAAESDLYEGMSLFYDSVKMASKSNIAGAQQVHNELKKFFMSNKKKELNANKD